MASISRLSILVFHVVISVFFVFAAGMVTDATAGTPHILYGQIEYADGSTPADDEIKFEACLKNNEGEVLKEFDVGCGYQDGRWWVEVGNFETNWAIGDVLRLSFFCTLEAFDHPVLRKLGAILGGYKRLIGEIEIDLNGDGQQKPTPAVLAVEGAPCFIGSAVFGSNF